MGLAKALEQYTKNAPSNAICSVVKAKELMAPEDLEIFEKTLYDRRVKASVLGRALRAEGIDVSETTITRHRNGGCKTCESR